MSNEITWQDLQPGLRKLEEMLQPSFDEYYTIQVLDNGLSYCEKKPSQRVVIHCNDLRKVLAFCREIS